MSSGLLSELLDSQGFARAECPPSSADVRLSRLSRAAGDPSGHAKPLKTKGVPSVPAVPTVKGEVVGEGEREHTSREHEIGSGVARVQKESSAREQGRERLYRIAGVEGLDVQRVRSLDDSEAGELEQMDDNALAAYARALVITAERRAGRVPDGSTQVAVCSGCGPVWVQPGTPEQVMACPWCLVRQQGVELPSCPDVPKGSEQ